jgi:hypothetical protein
VRSGVEAVPWQPAPKPVQPVTPVFVAWLPMLPCAVAADVASLFAWQLAHAVVAFLFGQLVFTMPAVVAESLWHFSQVLAPVADRVDVARVCSTPMEAAWQFTHAAESEL